MLIYLLFFIFAFLFLTSYVAFNKNITAPAIVYVTGYLISVFSALFNVSYWGTDLHWETVMVMTYGTFLFCATSFIVYRYYKLKYFSIAIKSNDNKPIEYNNSILTAFCVLQFFLIVVWLYYLFTLFVSWGKLNNFTEAMSYFRHWSSYTTHAINNAVYMNLNRIIGNVIVSSFVLATISTFNYVTHKSLKKERLPIISIVLTMILMLLQGARGGIVWIFMTVAMFYLLFYLIKNKSFPKLKLAFCIKFLLFVLFGAVGFYFLKSIVGRGGNYSFTEMIKYFGFYMGAQTQLMDMFITDPISASSIWGKETFQILNTELIKLGLLDVPPYIWHLEFRYAPNGAFLGNSYPSYRSYLYDFGYFGLTILPIIYALIVNIIYYRYIYCSKNVITLSLLYYSTIFYTIFFDFSKSNFYSAYVSLLSVRQIFMLLIFYFLFVKKDSRYLGI